MVYNRHLCSSIVRLEPHGAIGKLTNDFKKINKKIIANTNTFLIASLIPNFPSTIVGEPGAA